ncbi:MAG: cation:proton antiporter [Candidatus Binataceae bacterium]|nr:cation:proton antiporter [Candidatus Binataceae bacterium]
MLFVSHNILEDLGLVLCVAAVTTVVFQKIRQPVVVGYLVAGMIVGPHVAIPLLADHGRIETLSELGVILLMFALGLEFSLRKLLKLGPTAGFVTALQVALMIWLGFMVGRALGWSELESIFGGALLSISSTTIVAKAYGEQPVREPVRVLVFGVLLTEDLAAVMLLAVLTALASGAGLSTTMMTRTVGQLVLFLALMVGGGLLIVPGAVRWIVRLGRPETTLVASIGVCFAFAIIAERAGYSVALGAFLAGSLVAESGAQQSIEHLITPVRDMFAAVFFVSVGMMIDPAQILAHWGALALLIGAVIGGKFVSVAIASLLAGSGPRTAVQAAMSLTQIGEFSFIIAGLGIRTNATREFLYTLAVAVSAITTFTTPFMIRASEPVADFVGRRLISNRLRSMQVMYDALIQRARGARRDRARAVLPVALLLSGAIAIAVILILNETDPFDLTDMAQRAFGVGQFRAGLLVDLGALMVCVPFAAAMAMGAHKLAHVIAGRASRNNEGAPDMTEALIGVLRAAILFAVVTPLLAFVQPFVAPFEGIGAMVIGIAIMIVVSVRAGHRVQWQLGKLTTMVGGAISSGRATNKRGKDILTPIQLSAGARAIGKTLAELDLGGATGAIAVAIARDGDGAIFPTGHELLRENDVIEVAGSAERVAAARILLLQ